MKIKDNFVLREVAGTWVVLPLAEQAVDATRMLSLNETGAVLWKALETECDIDSLVAALTAEYNVTKEEAMEDAKAFVQKLLKAGCLDMNE